MKDQAKSSRVLKYGFIKKRIFFALFENNLNTLRVFVLKQTETPGSTPSVSLGSVHPCTVQRTLLERVVLQGLTTSFEAAVNAGGNLKHKDYRGANLAHKACHSKRKAMLKMVMDAGVNPWEPDGRGMVCLHKIALESPNMIQMLLAHPEANPNAVDETGSTALFYLFPIQSTWAQKVVALKSVNTLLELGVDPNIRNKMGQTFLDIARSRSSTSANTTLTKMLEETVDRFQNYKLAVTLDDIVGSPATASRKKM